MEFGISELNILAIITEFLHFGTKQTKQTLWLSQLTELLKKATNQGNLKY